MLSIPTRALIMDMDGVLWRGDQPIGDLPAVFAEIRRHKLHFVLATNNSTLSALSFVKKLSAFGVTVELENIVNSAHAVAHYLSTRFPAGGPLFIIGEAGLVHTLAENNFYHDEHNPLAIVAGMDRQLTYNKLRQATLFIRAGKPFIGTNPDRSFPTPEGLVPGAGSILAALEAATDVSPTIIGKPNPQMYQVALERMGVMAAETLVIGDRLETDIAGAQALGCPTGLVLSGVTTQVQAQAWQPAPTFIAADLADLLRQQSWAD